MIRSAILWLLNYLRSLFSMNPMDIRLMSACRRWPEDTFRVVITAGGTQREALNALKKEGVQVLIILKERQGPGVLESTQVLALAKGKDLLRIAQYGWVYSIEPDRIVSVQDHLRGGMKTWRRK